MFVTDNLLMQQIWWGGGQNLEQPNVERPIFRNFETSNIKITSQIYLLFLRQLDLFKH